MSDRQTIPKTRPNAAFSAKITPILSKGNSKSTAVVWKNLKTNQSSTLFCALGKIIHLMNFSGQHASCLNVRCKLCAYTQRKRSFSYLPHFNFPEDKKHIS